MKEAFKTYIATEKLFNQEDKILLAVSGGMDSVAMAQLFADTQQNFAIAHANFGLRGDESDADEQFVQKLAKKMKVPFFVKHFEMEKVIEQEGKSTQMLARELRYFWFDELLKAHDYQYLATAHHQQDFTETILLNLLRGTGLAGLHGIKAKSGKIVRPIIFADKEAIMEYVASRQIVWREDSSNASDKYLRNKIRHEVVPVLKSLNPQVNQAFTEMAHRVSAAEKIYNRYIAENREQILSKQVNDTYLDIKKLLEQEDPFIVLYEILRSFNFSYRQSQQVFESVEGMSGKVFYSASHIVNIDREQIIISPVSMHSYSSITIYEPGDFYTADSHYNIRQFKRDDSFKISTDAHIAQLDADLIKFPLICRKWQTGDNFMPLGMKNKKKLSDFLIDTKVPVNLKERVQVICYRDKICWVIGHRLDNRFKITAKTKNILEIKKIDDKSI